MPSKMSRLGVNQLETNMINLIADERRFLSASAKGGRDEQQDAAICLAAPDGAAALIIVSDGLGGESGGRIAAQQVIESAQQFWENHHGVFTNPLKDLETLCQTAHDQINRKGAETDTTPRATIVALYLTPTQAHWIHSGDSRLYRFRGGKFVQRTEDHSLVQLMVKQRLAKEEELGTHASQSLLVQSLGGEEFKQPSGDSAALGPEDGFLLCTDGFWQRTTLEEMQQLFRSSATLSTTLLERAVKSAVERNGPDGDNVTVALALPATSPGSATGARSIFPKPAALPRASSRKPIAIAGAALGLAVLVILGLFSGNEFLNSKGVSTNASPVATPQQTPVIETRVPTNDDQEHPVTVATTATPPDASPKPIGTSNEQIEAEATPTPAETPKQSGTPSTAVATTDPRLVGKWQTRTERGIETWTQDPDGNYTLAGPINDKGTLTTENGKIRQYFPSSNLTQELMYEVTGDGFITTAPDGKKTAWRVAGTLAETIHPTHPRHHVEDKPTTFWQRFIHWFPFR